MAFTLAGNTFEDFVQIQETTEYDSNDSTFNLDTEFAVLESAEGNQLTNVIPESNFGPVQNNFLPPKPAAKPYVAIVEQPKTHGFRFRYQCEGRSAGSIPGENSTNEKKTFPSIKIYNVNGPAVVIVSCVTKDSPPKPHPHSLVGKDCKRGVCTMQCSVTDTISFPNLGIQCVKKKEVADALNTRKEINVDPFKTGFSHANNMNIDFSVICLCFQTFITDEQGKFTVALNAVVSHPIIDKKTQNELSIVRMDKCSGRACGRDEVFLLCEKVAKDNIRIRFFENDSPWEDYGEFNPSDVHRQYAIVFKTPPYKNIRITKDVTVFLQLVRPSDSAKSEPMKFTYQPEDPDPDRIEEKRKRKVTSTTLLSDGQSINRADLKNRLRLRAIRDKDVPKASNFEPKLEESLNFNCAMPSNVMPPMTTVPTANYFTSEIPFSESLPSIDFPPAEDIALLSEDTLQNYLLDFNPTTSFSTIPGPNDLPFANLQLNPDQ
ncbi:putative transcription factor p65 homolog [Argonauta hians]